MREHELSVGWDRCRQNTGCDMRRGQQGNNKEASTTTLLIDDT